MNAILVPTDLSPASQNATNYAGHLCRELGAKMILLHVYMLPVPVAEIPYIMVTADEMHGLSEDALKKESNRVYNSLGIEIEWVVRLGMASDEIRDVEQERNTDLIVMGMKGAGQVDMLIGSTTTAVIRKCHKAVLVVPLAAKFSPFKSVAYATDFSYQISMACLESLKALLLHFKARLEVVNIQKAGQILTPGQIAGKLKLEPVLGELMHTHHTVEADDIDRGLQQFIENHLPGMLVMLVHKHTLFERLFGAHHTVTMLHRIEIPLLVLKDKD